MTEDETGPTRRSLLAAAASAGVASAAGCSSITTPADVAASTEIGGNVDFVVGGSWLQEHRDDVVVLDARSRDLYRRQRVFGSRLVQFDDVRERTDTDGGAVPDTEAIAKAVGDVGVRPEDDVVIYGDSVGSRVTRTAFALIAAGHAGDVSVLNGGLDGWNGRVGTGSPSEFDAVDYEADPRPDVWVDRDWLAERVGSFNEDGGPGLVDVRVPEAYLAAAGSDALDPDHDRHGHLPGAVDVHWVGNVAGRQFADPSDLFTLYADEAELPEDGPTVVYGDENVDPTQTWLTLRAIGFEDVRLYEGGFREWSNAEDAGRYPVETSTNVVVETDGQVGDDGDSGDFSCTG